MADYVLIHGGNVSTDTWNALTKTNEYSLGEYLGGKVWNRIAYDLKAAGHRVFTPTLKDEHEYGLYDHIQQVCDLINEHNLRDIILVGHSYGGMVITGVADKISEKIGLLVYLDAALPRSGQSLLDILTLGGLNAESILGGKPKAYTEKLLFNPRRIQDLSKVFIFCTESEFTPVTAEARKKIASEQTKWQCFDLPTSHLPQCTAPDRLSELLLRLGKNQ